MGVCTVWECLCVCVFVWPEWVCWVKGKQIKTERLSCSSPLAPEWMYPASNLLTHTHTHTSEEWTLNSPLASSPPLYNALIYHNHPNNDGRGGCGMGRKRRKTLKKGKDAHLSQSLATSKCLLSPLPARLWNWLEICQSAFNSVHKCWFHYFFFKKVAICLEDKEGAVFHFRSKLFPLTLHVDKWYLTSQSVEEPDKTAKGCEVRARVSRSNTTSKKDYYSLKKTSGGMLISM